MSKRFKDLDKAMCNELEKLDKKYRGDVAEMTAQDLERADMLYHAMKSAETYYAMVEAEGEEDEEGMSGEGGSGRNYRSGRGNSYARYRSPRTGRFISRDDGWSGRYSGDYGYSGYSGRYPMDYIDPYWDRR